MAKQVVNDFSKGSIISNILKLSIPMTLAQLGCLLLAGLFASGGQFTITAAYTCAPAGEISIYDYSQIIFSTVLGFLFLRQIPDMWSFVGYGIIIAASVAMFLFNNRKRV